MEETPVKDVITSVGQGIEGIELSPKGIAMVDVAIAAEMVHAYAVSVLAKEVPTRMEEVREEIQVLLKQSGQFDLNTLKFSLFDVLQIVMTDIAQLSLVYEQRLEAEAVAAEVEKAEREPCDGCDTVCPPCDETGETSCGDTAVDPDAVVTSPKNQV